MFLRVSRSVDPSSSLDQRSVRIGDDRCAYRLVEALRKAGRIELDTLRDFGENPLYFCLCLSFKRILALRPVGRDANSSFNIVLGLTNFTGDFNVVLNNDKPRFFWTSFIYEAVANDFKFLHFPPFGSCYKKADTKVIVLRLAEPPHATLIAACTAAPSGQARKRQHRRLGVAFAPHDFTNAVCVGAQPLNDIRIARALISHDVHRDGVILRQSLALDCDFVQCNTGDPVTRYSHGVTPFGYVIRRLCEGRRIGLSALRGAVSLARQCDSHSPAGQITNISVFASFSSFCLGITQVFCGKRIISKGFGTCSLSIDGSLSSVFQFDPLRCVSRTGMCAWRRAGQRRGGGFRDAAVPTSNSRGGAIPVLMSRNRGRGAARKSPNCLDHLLAGLLPGQHFSGCEA